jgi:hypothetical protein
MRSGGRVFRLVQHEGVLFHAIGEDEPMPDWIARLYIELEGRLFRVKVLENTIWIERQRPHASNMPFSRQEDELAKQIYQNDTHLWHIESLEQLIWRYEDEIGSEDARHANSQLPTIDDVKAANPRADGYFTVRYDGGGEFVLWFIDYGGSIAGRAGEPVQRNIHVYQDGAPDASTAAAHARQWLADNADWL